MKPKVLIPVRSMYRDTLLPEDMMRRLEEFGEIELAVDPADLTRERYVDLYRGKDAVLTTWNTPLIDRDVLEAADELKIISHAGGEVRPFITPDLFSIRPDIVLCNASGVMAPPVAEHTLAVSLALLRGLFKYREYVKTEDGWWGGPGEWNVSLLRKRVGIVGLGQIAREFIGLLAPFDVEILVFSRHLDDERAAELGVRQATLEEIFSTSDVISISAAATEKNRHMVGRELLRLIKPGAVFVNNARGMLVDEAALIEELRTGRFQAAIDVTDPEPPAMDNPLRNMPNVLLTPHTGGPTPEQRIWMMEEAFANLRSYFTEGVESVRGLIDKQRFSYMA